MNESLPQRFVVAIDGPGAAGKSTIAKLLATKYKMLYLDTGAMYRGITLLALQNQLKPDYQIGEICELASKARFEFSGDAQKRIIKLNGEDITDKIRNPEVSKLVSTISEIPEVRKCLDSLQRDIARDGRVILDGRDIGTVVFPDADLKIYLIANATIRAQRRYKEQIAAGIEQPFKDVLQDLENRDYLDMNRCVSPLMQAKDAIPFITDNLSIDEVIEHISKIIEGKPGVVFA